MRPASIFLASLALLCGQLAMANEPSLNDAYNLEAPTLPLQDEHAASSFFRLRITSLAIAKE